MKHGMNQVIQKLQDHMLIGSIYDNIMMKTKYRDDKLCFLYNVMVAQKHRMLYYKMLKKKYLKKCSANPVWEQKKKVQKSDVIWVCWLQGFDSAPLLVQRCIESLKQQLPHKKLILLDETNLADYVEMPEDIVAKWKKGIIGNAHFTDLVRLELLIRHGGYWIDATVLCTSGKMLEYIDQEPIFMYSFYYFGFNPEIMELNNWFIKSDTNNNILSLLLELLYCYWRENNRAADYFMTQLFMTMAVEHYEEEYSRMPIVSQVDAHILATYIFDDFDNNKYKLLKNTTGFHKLSTRFDADKMEKTGTFYDVVIRQGKH